MKKHRKLCLILFLTIAALIITVGLSNLRFTNYTAAGCVESTAELNNPYIGWYRIYTYALSDAGVFDPNTIPEQEQGPGLAMLQFNLHQYAQSSISSAGLQQLDEILSAWSSTGRQLILRFLYDWDGDALDKEPGSLDLILEHMSQTSEIVNRYSGQVYILQGIFAGAWGEMHSSNYMAEKDMLTLIHHLAAVTDTGIFLAVRTPEQWRTITRSSQPLSLQEAFNSSLPARLSLFNDGMLGSETDLNTYGTSDEPFSPTGFGKRSRPEELLFQNVLCRYVPNGGEVVVANPYNDFPTCVQDLSLSHVSYLNRDYDTEVLSKWRQSTYQGEDLFNGMNGYDYISRHLGYRYVVRSSILSLSTPLSWEAVLSVSLENVGFANSCRDFDVSLILRDQSGGREITLPVQTDTRLWDAGEPVSLTIPLETRSLPLGSYKVFLGIRDPVSGSPVLLGNEGVQEDGSCLVGSLSLNHFPQ